MNTIPYKIFLCFVLVNMAIGGAFAQVSDLALDSSDIRFEPVYSNDTLIVGYNLFVRKRQGIESVLLTEPSGYHALRSMEWNSINGSERRELSGVPLSGAYSRYSIVSSTPIPDLQFGSAFLLYIPQNVIYGNPSSPSRTVIMNIKPGFQINIRTFDHKFADPNTGRFQNNLTLINSVIIANNYYPSVNMPAPPAMETRSRDDDIADLKTALRRIGISEIYLGSFRGDMDLEIFLQEVFMRRYHGQN